MKQKFLCVIAVYLPFFVFCQSDVVESGITWTEGLTWKQVQEKAKKQNKYIFVDAYATWCKPCKEMDKDVYTVDSVGDYLNAQFISVKVQMDQTKSDDAEVKSWYNTAKEMMAQYRISAFPSYIFFAPTGDVASKEVGYKEPAAFIQAARNATDPSKQYFVLLKKYKEKQLDHAGTLSLIKMAQQIGDTADYRQVLNSYHAYINKQKKEKLYTKENIEFIASTLDRSNMVLFKMFYPNGKRVNTVMQNDWYAKKVVDKIIDREKVQPFLNRVEGSKQPDWNVLHQSIAKNYGDENAGRNILNVKVQWYLDRDNWPKGAAALNDRMEKYGTDTTDRGDDFRLNNYANWIWEHLGTSKELSVEAIKELKRTAAWMQGVVRRGATATGFRLEQWPLYIDTYANLLHKVGNTAEAIKWEELAVAKQTEQSDKDGYLELYKSNLDKMRKGEPNWPMK